MTETATHARIQGEENSAAVFDARWLPGAEVDLFPELTELRETHDRIRAAWKAESANVLAIEKRLEADKKVREQGMRDAFLAGTPVDEVAAETEALSLELAQARERDQGALNAYLEHINICIAAIVEHRFGWLEQINEREAGVLAEIADLKQKLIAAEGEQGALFKLAYWIDRTGGDAAEFPPAHIPYQSIPPLPSKDPAELARERDRFMEQSYAGGLPGAEKISDADSIAQEEEFMVPALSDQQVANINAQVRGPGVLVP